jgi:hypothetical protein
MTQLSGTVVLLRPELEHQPPFIQPDCYGHKIDDNVLFIPVSPVYGPEADAPEPEKSETYGRSMRAMKAVGNIALQGSREQVLASPETKRLKREFDTSFGEMLKTADGLSELVRVEDRDSFMVSGGRVVCENGEAVEDMIERGVVKAQELAALNPIWEVQAERDTADKVLLTKFVQPMWDKDATHNTTIAVLAFPEDGVAQSGQAFWQERGYNTKHKCAMLQLSHRGPDDKLYTRTLSVDGSDMKRLAAHLRARGVAVPDDISVAELATHPWTGDLSLDEAYEWMNDYADSYEAGAGLPPKVATTYQLVQEYAAVRRRVFQEIYLEIAKSLAVKQCSNNLGIFLKKVRPIMGGVRNIEGRRLYRTSQKAEFEADDARIVHGAVLYGLAETVRAELLARSALDWQRPASTPASHSFLAISSSIPFRGHPNELINHIGNQFNAGVRAGRSYGGCGALFKFSGANPMDIFGGKTKETIEDDDTDDLGSRHFTCSKGHPNYRAIANQKVKHCRTCGEDVSCEDK